MPRGRFRTGLGGAVALTKAFRTELQGVVFQVAALERAGGTVSSGGGSGGGGSSFRRDQELLDRLDRIERGVFALPDQSGLGTKLRSRG